MKFPGLLIFLCISITSHAQTKTEFSRGGGEFTVMLKQLDSLLVNSHFIKTVHFGGKPRTIFVPWIRDHVHVMKAMKYLHPDMKSFLEFFLENQTEEGIIFDYYFPLNIKGISLRKKLFDQRYWKEFPEDSIEMHRLPVEADLEYLMAEGVYAVYQSTGDLQFVRKWLPALEKGMRYMMTDPLRWSKKHQLVKRGYTLDTWDFMQLPLPRKEYTAQGGDVQKGIFNIDEQTPMGIMHGDNSGMYAACNQLSVLYDVLGDKTQAARWKSEAAAFRKKTNALCWNGRYYKHFVEDDPQPAYLNMDQANTLSLSNPYDINRGLPDEKMAQSIIETYRQLYETNKKNSFAEWYGVYPPVEPHFADYLPGSYMNGGVNTIVAGELAKAAFSHGYEDYGMDILKRLRELMITHKGDLPVAYTPQGKVDEGIPDNWGQAAVYNAMIEGLAGVKDLSARFGYTEISPRWAAAGKDSVSVSVTYGPVSEYVHYAYFNDRQKKEIRFRYSGSPEKAILRMLLPPQTRAVQVLAEGKAIPFSTETVRNSLYVVVKDLRKDRRVVVVYQ